MHCVSKHATNSKLFNLKNSIHFMAFCSNSTVMRCCSLNICSLSTSSFRVKFSYSDTQVEQTDGRHAMMRLITSSSMTNKHNKLLPLYYFKMSTDWLKI